MAREIKEGIGAQHAEPLTPAEDALLANLASQAGLVLRNVGLTTELLARLDEPRQSRMRLVGAQDQERRRIERDLHDGAQQHLVALKTRPTMVKRIGERDPGKALELIPGLEELGRQHLRQPCETLPEASTPRFWRTRA